MYLVTIYVRFGLVARYYTVYFFLIGIFFTLSPICVCRCARVFMYIVSMYVRLVGVKRYYTVYILSNDSCIGVSHVRQRKSAGMHQHGGGRANVAACVFGRACQNS